MRLIKWIMERCENYGILMAFCFSGGHSPEHQEVLHKRREAVA